MEKLKEAKKITRATFKSFVKRNYDNLYLKRESTFDGMIDGSRSITEDFNKVQGDRTKITNGETLGIPHIWIVPDNRNLLEIYEDDTYYGIHVYNCCKSFTIAVKK